MPAPGVMSAGQAVVNAALPPELRDYSRTLSGKDLDDVLERLAAEHPDKYKDVSFKLMQSGAEAAYNEGVTISMKDLEDPDPIGRAAALDHISQQEAAIKALNVSDKEKLDALGQVYGEVHKSLVEGTMKAGVAVNNTLAHQVVSKARGNPLQLTAMLSTPGTFTDGQGRTIPIFIKNSFSSGLRPHEYYASAFGARKGAVSTKFATRDAGDLGKQMATAASSLMVTTTDCKTSTGFATTAGDKDNIGAVLAKDFKNLPAGTVITAKHYKDFKDSPDEPMFVRSTTTCEAHKGICQRCAGIRETGRFAELGDHVGITAASAKAERIAQGSLNTKHNSGQSLKGDDAYGGFKYINQLAQMPESFADKATVSEVEGKVTSITAAPQGGSYVKIGTTEHYVPHGYGVRVKEGDDVDPGDRLSDGLINPADVVRLKGIGGARHYLTHQMTKAYRAGGLGVHRRNVESTVRAMLDHVVVDDLDSVGDHLPGDVVSYSALAASYKPRPDAVTVKPQEAIGKYLEAPALHYTIGTKVTRSIAKDIEKYQPEVVAHPVSPGFTPVPVRLRTSNHHDEDWASKLQGSYLEKNLITDTQRGASSDIHGTNPVPALLYGMELGRPKPGTVSY